MFSARTVAAHNVLMDYKVSCRECRRRRDARLVIRSSKSGGGTYRRGGRKYIGQTCLECIEHAAQWLSTRDGQIDRTRADGGYSASTILDGVAEFIERGHSDLDENRWRAMWFPDAHHQTFDEYFPMLRAAIEDSLARREQWRADDAERHRKWAEEREQR